jgi:DNA polymerase-3 subunit alpha
MAALMTSVVGNKDKQSAYLVDCRKLGIEVLPPSINLSGIDFEVFDNDKIIFGLSAINGVGASIADSIISCRDINRPYQNIFDFFRRCDPAILKKTTLEHLANAGAFDDLIQSSSDSFSRLEELEILEREKSDIGIYVTSHPVNGIWDIISSKITSNIIDLQDYDSGTLVKVGGIITDVKTIITKKNQKMYKVILEDITSDVEIILFPSIAKKYDDSFFIKGDSIVVTGSISRDGDEEASIVKIFLNSVEKIDSHIFSSGKSIILETDASVTSLTVEKIYDIIKSARGDRPVYIKISIDRHCYMYKFPIEASASVEKVIKDLISLEN